MGRGCVSPLSACAVLVVVVSGTLGAQDRQLDGSLTEVVVPGGIRSALAQLEDRVAPDRSQFLLELIRRFHSSPIQQKGDPRLIALQSLVAQFETPIPASTAAAQDTIPLPLPPQVWIAAVFGGGATPETLVAAILRSRKASLLYCALLSLDDPTRQWLATRPAFVTYLADHAAAFLVAAPGLRVRDGRMQPPGGVAAKPVWLALAKQPDDPEQFIRTTVEAREGRLAYFVGSLGELTAAQLTFALRLDASNPQDRVTAASRVFAAFQTAAGPWVIERQPFFRPAFDPALLLGDLAQDQNGRPLVPGDTGFWNEVFADSRSKGKKNDGEVRDQSDASVEFPWLCSQVFTGIPFHQRRRYNLILFASRTLREIPRELERDAIDAVRAAAEYPALVATLERAGVTDVRVLAAAARRAATLTEIRDRTRAVRGLSQFQGAVALIARAGMRGGLPAGSISRLVSSLSAVDLSERGAYDGAVVRWVDAHLAANAETAAPIQSADELDGQWPELENRLVARLAGDIAVNPPFVDWEGTRYRVDLPKAETERLLRLLGIPPVPFFTSARSLLAIAERLDDPDRAPRHLRNAADLVAHIGKAVADDLSDDDADRYRKIAESLERAHRTADASECARLAAALRELADGLLGRGLVDLAYAVAFGQPGAAAISAREAARRHDFGTAESRRDAWQLPHIGGDKERAWHVTGSVLGLEVALAQFWLTRISSRPPVRAPSLDESDRAVFVQAVTLVEPAALSAPSSEVAMAALRRGRSRLATARSMADVRALADEIRLSTARRSLLTWAFLHEPERVAESLSLSELVWLGADTLAPQRVYDAWGAPAEPRLGCLCLRLGDRRPWETLAGRWHAGMLASRFPDLNLRIGELLAELQMPPVLLPAVLAAATVDLVENAECRDQDDRRGLLEFVRRVSRERLEEYLALLTTDGPLVPVGDALDPMSKPRRVP